MVDFQQSTQKQDWFFDTVEQFKKKQIKLIKKQYEKIDKFTQKPAGHGHTLGHHVPNGGASSQHPPHHGQSSSSGHHSSSSGLQAPIYKIVREEHQQQYIAYVVGHIITVCTQFRFPQKILGISLTYFRRFYLKQSVFEFDPIEMMFACIYLALKIEEYSMDLETFCTKVNQKEKCTPEKIESYEVLLVRGLSFQLQVLTPMHVYEYLLETIQESMPSMNLKQLQKLTYENILKCYLSNSMIFTYTPSHLALACLDLGITQMSQSSDEGENSISSFTEYFPEISLEVLDKIGKAKENLLHQNKPKDDAIKKIRQYIMHFHKTHPEFLQQVNDQRKKRDEKASLCGFEDEPNPNDPQQANQLQVQQQPKVQEQSQQQLPVNQQINVSQSQLPPVIQSNQRDQNRHDNSIHEFIPHHPPSQNPQIQHQSNSFQNIPVNQPLQQFSQPEQNPSINQMNQLPQNQLNILQQNQQQVFKMPEEVKRSTNTPQDEFDQPLLPLRKRKSEAISGNLESRQDPTKFRKLNPDISQGLNLNNPNQMINMQQIQQNQQQQQ
eukprot:403333988